ncbi:MAG TPA: nucleotide sugar dehydrogenase [Luteolibacter sp.]|nr:nucleotide sugar dehydrogenase [Luteolibacter sp.]
MKITVLGLWHLGSVTAACCAEHFQVTGLDSDTRIVDGLKHGKAPISEPGLDELIASGIAKGSLRFTVDAREACGDTDVLWLCADTPVDEDDVSDVAAVTDLLKSAMPYLPDGKLILISSQLPVGTCAALEKEYPGHHFACCPENLRLGKAIEVFTQADRYVIGLREDGPRALLEKLFAPFTEKIVFMGTESAEMVKHAINSFLATSITFINEIARLCESTGADAAEVSVGLKTDVRIGPKAYLGPGGPFAGGTLARDVVTLTGIAAASGREISLIPAIKQSNDRHRRWAFERLRARLGDLQGKAIGILGLTYKPGTDTLRRSAAVELCAALTKAGCVMKAFDPSIHQATGLQDIILVSSIREALDGADAAVVCTEWPEFRDDDLKGAISGMKQPIIVDANRFLEKSLKAAGDVELLSVGRL